MHNSRPPPLSLGNAHTPWNRADARCVSLTRGSDVTRPAPRAEGAGPRRQHVSPPLPAQARKG